MKKIICVFLVLFVCLGLTSCYTDLEENSLEEYIDFINRNKCGYGSTSIDNPQFLLPSISFFQEYNYIDGSFYWREDDPLRGTFTTDVRPEIALLYLKYEEDIYYEAKQEMLEKIKPYNDKFYLYNNYVFYENSNYIDVFGANSFPKSFTMACYNDENQTLIFIGLDSGTVAGPSCLEEKYLEDIESNWEDFIRQYFGQHYDFDN